MNLSLASATSRRLATRLLAPLALGVVLATASSDVLGQGAMRVAASGRATTEVELTWADSAARVANKPLSIRIDYGQPSLRGRQLYTDSLVPYDKAWRLGANSPTMLYTDVDLIIGGAIIPKGNYVLQAIPSKAGWKLLVEKEAGVPPVGAAISNNSANDVAKIDMKQSIFQTPVESLTIWLIPSTTSGPARGELRMAWGVTMQSTSWSTR